MNLQNRKMWLWVIGVGILFPLFFRLGGGIYRDVNQMVDSQGVLKNLPLPVSILTCLLGIALLARNLGRVSPALAMIFGTIAVSFISLWLGGDGETSPQRKLIMIMQVVLPLGGVLLGQLVDDSEKVLARAFLVVLSIVVPLQLLATWLQGGLGAILTNYLYVFSIYSHFQYVTLIFVCAFAYSLTSLWDEHKVWLCVLGVPMVLYVTVSYSFLTIFAYMSLLIAFAVSKLWVYRTKLNSIVVPLVMVAIIGFGTFLYFEKTDDPRASVSAKFSPFHGKFESLLNGEIPSNVLERFNDWKLFGNGIIESKKTILVGHPQPMPREIRSSPHNWYMDIIYTFGLVALLPILTLGAYTAYLCWRQRKMLSAQTWWLTAIVFYLVVIDSNFKVTLRQPYPGIFAYFMWGLLLSRLHPAPTPKHGA